MSALPTDRREARRRRPRVTPLRLLGGIAAAVLLPLLVAALLGSASVAVVAVLLGAAAIVALAVWTSPAQGSYRQVDSSGAHAAGYGGAWGGDAGGGGGGDGGGGC